MLSPLEELYFWSDIMSDHGDFIFTLLSPKETEYIKRAIYFKTEWSKINHEARALLPGCQSENAKALINKAVTLLKDFIEFKKLIVTKLLKCDIEFNQVPSFINHMLSEANEFYRNLYLSIENKKMNPYDEAILLHKLWLRDASGHAAAIVGSLDPIEALLVKTAIDFKDKFNLLFIKSYELGLMIERTEVDTNSISYLNEEDDILLSDFIVFLELLEKLRTGCKATGFFTPQMASHMIREEKYYLSKVKKTL